MVDTLTNIDSAFEDLKTVELVPGRSTLTVHLNGVKYEFIVNIKNDSDKLLVIGSGAYDPKKHKPPIFHRHTWASDFEESTIFYNDPTLYVGDINIGWGYGTSDRHYIQELSSIISLLAKNLQVETDNIVFYGSSCGGFMSILLAGLFVGSRAVVNNPQTNVAKYHKTHVDNLYQAVYGESDDDFHKFDLKRIDAIKFFESTHYVPEIVYIQNLASQHDVSNHLVPFIQGLSKLDGEAFKNKVSTIFYHDKERGHNPLDKEETIEFINQALYK